MPDNVRKATPTAEYERMPLGMGGRRCLVRLLEIDPAVRVIVATGYGTDDEELAVRQDGARGFIAKPYRPAELNRIIRRVLDTE